MNNQMKSLEITIKPYSDSVRMMSSSCSSGGGNSGNGGSCSGGGTGQPGSNCA